MDNTTISDKKIVKFALQCILNAKPCYENRDGMQIFRKAFDMKLGIEDFDKMWSNKFQRSRREMMYDLGHNAIYSREEKYGDMQWLSGAVEQLGRLPNKNDNFYFEYYVGGTNFHHRFFRIEEWNDELNNLSGEEPVPMRRALIDTEVRLIYKKD